MEKSEIKVQVIKKIDLWTKTKLETFGRDIIFSEKSVELLCNIIENIEIDRSSFWLDIPGQEIGGDLDQRKAIELLPYFFDDTISSLARRSVSNNDVEFKVTTWEILHALSKNLDWLCFIPKRRR
jgi:hypothetical protein